ncbi:MAG: carboxymuconolactone decarboxylase family protein [Hyphomicrobiaceae bacterium]
MTDNAGRMSVAFQLFLAEAPQQAQAWMTAVRELDATCTLDRKTRHLAYLAVLAALRLTDGVPFHVGLAKEAGATREEIKSAILVGLPAAGNAVVHALPPALEAFDAS